MNYKCYADNCYSNPVGYCSCNGVPTLFCLIHSHKHIKINRDHRIYDMAANPLSETHKNLLKISQFKISLKITQKTLLSESLELVKLIKNSNQTCQDHINELIKDCDQMILRLALRDGYIRWINFGSTVSRIASGQIQDSMKKWNHEVIKNFSLLKDLIKETLDISKLSPDEKEIMFLKLSTKQLYTLNLDTFETQTKSQNSLPEDINWATSICELPNRSKFCYGNYNSGLTFIIDQETNIKFLPDGKPNYCLDSKYYENFVYAIGGEHKLAEKYNLLENKWEICASLNYDHDFTYSRSSLLGSEIVIVGAYHRKVIIYYINQNYYLELTGINLEVDIFKFSFTDGKRVYIGECEKNVYESGENDLLRWTCISKTNLVTGNYQISYCSLISESVYFLNSNYNLYEFKLRTKEMKLIKNYN